MTVKERVDNGIALLDREKPGWRDQINPRDFDIRSAKGCALGQVFGDYGSGRNTLGLDDPKAADHGFARVGYGVIWDPTPEEELDWAALTEEWKSRFEPTTKVVERDEDLVLA